MDIMSLTAVEFGKKIKAKEISVTEATQAYLDQIEKVENDVHSYVTIDKEGALKRAEEVQKMIDDGRIDQFVADRYASWNTGIGADIISGKATMADLEAYALSKGDVTASLKSGRQEMLESILNNIMFYLQ